MKFFDIQIIKENKLKSIVYLLFILLWIAFQYIRGVYVTTDIYGGEVDFIWNDRAQVILLNVLTVFFFISLVSVKGFKSILVVYSILSGIIVMGDLAYGRYYGSPLSMTLIDQIKLISSLGESANSLIKTKDFYIIADIPILLLMCIYLKNFSFKIGYLYRFIVSFILFIVFGKVSVTKYKNSYLESYVYNQKEIGANVGVYTYHAFDLKNYFVTKYEQAQPISDEDLVRIESVNQAVEHSNEYTGLLEGKNLIILQLEAFQNFFINQEFNGVPVTPNLNKLISENSIYASNFYYETAGGNTVDAELLTNTGMLPTYSGSAYYLYPNNYYITMPHIFKELNYSTNSFHAYESTFWNREIMHSSLGFDKFYSEKDFEYSEEDILGWSLNDEKFLKDSLDKTLEAAGDSNFYSYMITLSSHYPYEGFYTGNYTWLNGEKETVPVFEKYLNAVQYVDYALGEFIEYMKEKGVYEDTVLVLVGDHGGLFAEERNDMVETLGQEATDEQFAKLETVPLIIHNPDIKESVTVTKVCGQKDTIATLGNLMNFDLPYTFSRDILDENYEGVAIKRYGNIYTNDFIFLVDKNKFYDYDTLEEITDDTLFKQYKEVVYANYEILKVNDLIYKYDYLRGYEQND
ncbi:MAG: LTA synthase family protein [Lachnospirales bacterium]